tara:strand:- start:207 stop:461 length:255 start_codon:yes stop_codon:yes gene_type:complete
MINEEQKLRYLAKKSHNKLHEDIEKIIFELGLIIGVAELPDNAEILELDLMILNDVLECLQDAEFVLRSLTDYDNTEINKVEVN